MSEEDLPFDEGPVTEEADTASGPEYHTLANGVLSPRHRRLAQLAALGTPNAKISEELGYSGSRVSILLKNPHIAAEVSRLQERVFEETIQQRLKSFAEPALANIEMILKDRTNRVKVSEKAEMSKWVVEKLDGKAVQKTDIGENLLAVLMDRLDARAAAPREVGQVLETEAKRLPECQIEQKSPTEEEDPLAAWVTDFDNASS